MALPPRTQPLPPLDMRSNMGPPPPPTAYDLAWLVLRQSTPPSVREILRAYGKSEDADRDVLLGLLAAKTAEDNRITAQTELHKSLVHLQYGIPLPPSPSPECFPTPHMAGSCGPPPHTYPTFSARPSHPAYLSPMTASSPRSRSPPITLPPLQNLGKRARTPSSTLVSPPLPSRMSVRGLLQEHLPNPEEPSGKRRHVEPHLTVLPVRSLPSHRTSHERTTGQKDEER